MERLLQRRKQRKIASTTHSQETRCDLTPANPQSRSMDSGPSESSLVSNFPDGVKVLHDCLDAAVDICFVHGLTGDRENTWTAHGQNTSWPQTLLPPKLNKARILTYGYDAYIVRKSVASSNRLLDHATNLLNDLTTERACCNALCRPLIFVAHSLGGLVCKEAILLSRHNPEHHLQGIFNNIKGIIFIGTPHKGSWMADWAKIPASALGLVKSTNIMLLDVLQRDNQFLESIQRDFLSMIRELREGGRRLEVTCFFEELPLPLVGKVVVSKESASLGGYTALSIHANHRDMVQFSSAEENGFRKLLGELVRWKSRIGQAQVQNLPQSIDALDNSGDLSFANSGAGSQIANTGKDQSKESDPLGLTVLYVANEPHTVDIIFVHGFGGSSRLTWCKDNDLHRFWPLYWLPADQDLRRARIMTFGYDESAVFTPKSSNLGITEFAKSLLDDMACGRDADGVRLDLGKVPIVFVTHSLGGLVFKKAYLDGQLDNRYVDIVAAIEAVIFLSTPHRGANWVEILKKILYTVPTRSSNQDVTELEQDAYYLRTINEQFSHVVPQLQIISFYETLKTRMGFTSTVGDIRTFDGDQWSKNTSQMILDDEAAKLGYPGQVSKFLHADHHNVCKFDYPGDKNYLVILEGLRSIVLALSSADRQQTIREIERLGSLLSVNSAPEHDLNLFWSRRADETCAWVMDRAEVLSWAFAPSSSAGLWIYGRPGRGKSVLSSFMVHHLQDQGVSAQYFFFRAGDETKQSISSFLRSLAFQVAEEVPAFRKFLLEQARTAWKPKEADWRSTWKKLFLNMLFQMDFIPPMYWIIDGVDECGSMHSFFELLEDLRLSATPIRVLFTSRWSQSMATIFDRMRSKLPSSVITIDEDLTDIRAYATMELQYLRWNQQIKDEVMARILEQANDNFLWVHLILKEIKDCNTEDDVRYQLEQLPAGMDLLYRRMEGNMATFRRPSDRSLCRQLLLWSVHARRSLLQDELAAILEPEFGRLLDLANTIDRLCGHFVVIEGKRQISMLHQTAREYLMTSSTLPFSLDVQDAHRELFGKSISAFSENHLHSKLASTSTKVMEYRATSWVHHLSALKSSVGCNEQLDVLVRFFTQPAVLVWIYVLASLGQLKVLIEASHCLANFVERQRKTDAVRDPAVRRFEDLELLESWSQDLLKIPGKFGSNLSEDPSSIYKSVPAFCPRSSSIYKIFGTSSMTALRVKGLPEDWDDCLARVLVGGDYVASLICCSGGYLAVVNNAGTISIWDCVTFHRVQLFDHGEVVSSICFSPKGDQLASYGSTTKVWCVQSAKILHTIQNPPSMYALCFQFSEDGTTLLAGMDRRCVLQSSLHSEDSPVWTTINHSLLNDDDSMEGTFLNNPAALEISPDGTKIAAAYRRFPLTIWSLVEPVRILKRVNRFGASQDQCKNQLPFACSISWHPNSEELIGFFNDGYVFRVNLVNGTYQEQPPDPGQMPSDIQCSPDGMTYAICRYHGAIRLYDYQTSTLIYQLTAENMISAFCFGQDGRRFFDVRGSYCNVWQPSSLIRLFAADDCPTHSDSVSAEESIGQFNSVSESFADDPTPTVLVAPRPYGSIVCLGDDDGLLELFDYSTNSRHLIDKTITGIAVEHLAWSGNGDDFCFSEVTGRVTLVHIEATGPGQLNHRRVGYFKPKSSQRGLKQLLVSQDAGLVLLSFQHSVSLWMLPSFQLIKTLDASNPSEKTGKWTQHPILPECLLFISPGKIGIHRWDNLERIWTCEISDCPVQGQRKSNDLSRYQKVQKTLDTIQEVVETVISTHFNGHVIVVMSRSTTSTRLSSRFIIIDATSLDPRTISRSENPSMLPIEPITIPANILKTILAPLNVLRNGQLVFIDKSFGLCTWQTRGQMTSQRHFFIPRDWLSEEKLSLLHVTAQGSILCPKQGGVTVVESQINSVW